MKAQQEEKMKRGETVTGGGQVHSSSSNNKLLLDGSDIMRLVEDDKAFSKYVDNKFRELDHDSDGKLSLNELKPAVADIGVALGLPSQGTSPDSDHIYSEILTEYFAHGKKEKVTKTEFKQVLSDILIGMAAGLKRDPVVILRIDGEDLHEFINGPTFETDMVTTYSHIQTTTTTTKEEEEESNDHTLKDYIIKALRTLTVAQGLPPVADPYVMRNVVEPALKCFPQLENKVITSSSIDQQLQEAFIQEFKKVAENIAQRLKEQPIIVAHSDNTFEGGAIRRLLTNKFELDKAMNEAMETLPKDNHGRISKEYLRVALDSLAPSAGLPPYGAINEMDQVINNVFKMAEADDGKLVKQEEFKKVLIEILGSIMLQLEGNPISVSSNSVVHEPIASASSILQIPTADTTST